MIDLLLTTLQLMLKGKLFRDPVQVYARLAVCNVVAALAVFIALDVQAPAWMLMLSIAVLGILVPYSLRHVKYR